jgi:hypothetical protein
MINNVTNLIQLSVAPVFLIAGVAGLLNVFTSRFVRIMDKLESLDNFVHQKELDDKNYKPSDSIIKRRSNLVKRMQHTNSAIFFAGVAGLMVALVIISVFFSSLLSYHADILISILFVSAMLFLTISLLLFLREIYLASSYIRIKKKNIYIE